MPDGDVVQTVVVVVGATVVVGLVAATPVDPVGPVAPLATLVVVVGASEVAVVVAFAAVLLGSLVTLAR